jgi:transcriptional regulator with XRE-family HTH domain
MTKPRDIFVKNLKNFRKKCGLSQEKLAEKAGVSTHHIAMIELSRNFPAIDLVERLAAALSVDVYELFIDPDSSGDMVEVNRQSLMDDIRQMVNDAVENAFARQDWKPKE